MSGRNSHPRFKVAAVQAGSVFRDAPEWLDLQATLAKAVGVIEEAGRNGARLIVLPECYLPTHPHWSLDVTDRPTFNDMWAQLLWNSVEVPGPETEVLCAAAKRANAYIAIGINERDGKYRGRMYNSILYLSPRGEILGTHRKICTTIQERLYQVNGDGGDNLRTVFKTEIGNLGGGICSEHCQLLLMHNWIMQGVQVHCALWPGQKGVERSADIETRSFCYTAHAFGVLSAAYVPEKDQPKNFHRNSRFMVPGGFRGGSAVVSPYGDYIAGPVYDRETIVYADIDLAETDKSRNAVNVTGIYSRWDLLSLNVRQETYEPVVPMEPMESPKVESKADVEERIKRLEQQVAALAALRSSNRRDEVMRTDNSI